MNHIQSHIKFSIIIVTYNSEKYIQRCLQSIINQIKVQNNFEIIIFDNASQDKTSEILNNFLPQIKFYQNQKNIGFASAVNQAFKMSKGENLLLINPDTVVEENFFEKLNLLLQNNFEYGILGFKLLDEKFRYQPSSWKKVSLLTIFLEMFLPYNLSIKLVTVSPKRQSIVENVSGACMLIKREVFEKLGGFDENFFLYFEEIDFCLRAKKSGYKIFYIPEISAVHYGAQSTLNNREIFYQNLYANKLYFLKKHFSKLFYSISYTFIIGGIVLRILTAFVGGVFSFNKNLIHLSQTLILVLKKILKSNVERKK